MKGPWKVTYSPNASKSGGAYGIYREKDITKPLTNENRELYYFGKICHIFGDRDTAQRVADDLNMEERKNDHNNIYNNRPWNNSDLP